MVSPLDPWIEAFQSDPITGMLLLVVGALLLVGPEILVAALYLRPMLAKKLRREIREQLLSDVDEGLLDPAIERATAGVETRIQEVKELVQTETADARISEIQVQVVDLKTTTEARIDDLQVVLEARFADFSIEPVQAKLEELDVALGGHLQAIQERMANLEKTLPGRVRSSLEGSMGTEIKEIQRAAEGAEGTAVELYEAELEPSERLLAQFDAMNPSPKWRQEHQVGDMIIQGVKEMVREQIIARRGNVVTMKRVGGTEGKGFPTIGGGR